MNVRLALGLLIWSFLGAGCATQPAYDRSIVSTAAAGLELVRIPSGNFIMGSPLGEAGREADETQHRVTIRRPFLIGKYEVTREQWIAVMQTRPWEGKRLVIEGPQFPAIYVTWNDAQAFVTRLNALEKTTAYRLPTEAEWEYAARAGTTGAFPGEPERVGWFADNSGRTQIDAEAIWDDDHQTRLKRLLDNGARYHAVGTAAANPFGLHDMHGNVWEWVADWYGDYAVVAATDSRGPANGELRVVRGGSWSLPKRFGRSGSRDKDPPGHTAPALGFRVARDVR